MSALAALALAFAANGDLCARVEGSMWRERCEEIREVYDPRAPCGLFEDRACALRRARSSHDPAVCEELGQDASGAFECRVAALAAPAPARCAALADPLCSEPACGADVGSTCRAVRNADLGACAPIADTERRARCLRLAALAVGGPRGCELLEVAGGRWAEHEACAREVAQGTALASLARAWTEPCADLVCVSERAGTLARLVYPDARDAPVSLFEAARLGDPISVAAVLRSLPAAERAPEAEAAFAAAPDRGTAEAVLAGLLEADRPRILAARLAGAIAEGGPGTVGWLLELGAPLPAAVQIWLAQGFANGAVEPPALELAVLRDAGVPPERIADLVRATDLPWDPMHADSPLRLSLDVSDDGVQVAMRHLSLDVGALAHATPASPSCPLFPVGPGTEISVPGEGDVRIEQRIVLRLTAPAGPDLDERIWVDGAPAATTPWALLPFEHGRFVLAPDSTAELPELPIDSARSMLGWPVDASQLAPQLAEREWRVRVREGDRWVERGRFRIVLPAYEDCC